MSLYRQGDLLFKRIDKLPKGIACSKDNVILEGEATGHCHRLINGTLFKSKYNWRWETYIQVNKDGRIVHEEHATLELPDGFYMVIRQREYLPMGAVNVLD